VVVLGVTTLTLYWVYWCYKNWRDLSKHLASQNADPQETKLQPALKIAPGELADFKHVSPLLRMVGMLFPYINNYLFFTLVLGIAKIYPDKDSFIAKRPGLSAVSIAIVTFALSNLVRLPDPFCMLFLLGVAPTAIAQHWLNRYWQSVEAPGLLVRHGFSLMELISIIVGALILGFIGAAFMLGIAK
jgi:hypothetical protein